MPSAEKRRASKERLGCESIAVNILEMEPSMDGVVVTCGPIESYGKVMPSAMESLGRFIV